MVDLCCYGKPILTDPRQTLAMFYQILDKLKIPQYRQDIDNPVDFIQIHTRIDFPQMLKTHDQDFRSRYFPFHDRIYVLDEFYTIRVAIHELLHAFSVYSHFNNLPDFRKIFGDYKESINDGHTEFITGLILYLYFPSCYEIWRVFYRDYDEDNFKWHIGHNTNPDWTKIWLSLAYHYDLRAILDMFFLGTSNTIADVCSRMKGAELDFLIDLEDKEMINLYLEDEHEDHAKCFENPTLLDYRWLDKSIYHAGVDTSSFLIKKM